MKHIAIIAVLVLTALSGPLSAGMRWEVTNAYRTDKINYERIQQIHIDEYDNGSGRLFYHEYFYVYGINQAEFTFFPIRYHASLTPEALKTVLAAIGKLDPSHLEAETKDGIWIYGTVDVGGKEYKVSALPDSKERKPWEDLFVSWREQFPAKGEERTAPIALQGDTIATVAVTFDDLLKRPAEYAGKRVRVLGHYHGEFEGSHFSRSKETEPEYEHAFWLGGYSAFVDSEKFSKINDTFIVVDATFAPHSNGHMGLWKAELSRVTAIRKATKQEVEQAGAGQPTTRSESDSDSGDKPQPESEARSR
jgi:hypothetical protein